MQRAALFWDSLCTDPHKKLWRIKGHWTSISTNIVIKTYFYRTWNKARCFFSIRLHAFSITSHTLSLWISLVSSYLPHFSPFSPFIFDLSSRTTFVFSLSSKCNYQTKFLLLSVHFVLSFIIFLLSFLFASFFFSLFSHFRLDRIERRNVIRREY